MKTAYGTAGYGTTRAPRTCAGGCERKLSDDFDGDTCPDCEDQEDTTDEDEADQAASLFAIQAALDCLMAGNERKADWWLAKAARLEASCS